MSGKTSHYCRTPSDIAHTSWIVPPLSLMFNVPGSGIFTTASNTLVGRGDLPFHSHPRLLVNGVIVIYFLDVMYTTGNIYATIVYLRNFLPGIWFVKKCNICLRSVYNSVVSYNPRGEIQAVNENDSWCMQRGLFILKTHLSWKHG